VSDQIKLSELGVLVGFSAVLHAPPGALVEVPYWIGVAQFENAISILGLIVGSGEGLEIGDDVHCVAICPAEGLMTYGYRVTSSQR